MVSRIDDAMFDLSLARADTNGTQIDILSGIANAFGDIAGLTLGNQTGLNTGAAEDGDTDGRKLTKDADDISITVGGTADAVALHDNVSVLNALTTLASTVVVSNGDTLQCAAWDMTVREPT